MKRGKRAGVLVAGGFLGAVLLVPVAAAVPWLPGGVTDPANVWAPYGPMISQLQLKFYTDEWSELFYFELGSLDIVDWPVPRAKWNAYDGHPDFALSPTQGEFGMFEIDFNHESSTWARWGCDFQNGNSACGVHIRQAFAHLFDRPRWVADGILQGAAQPLADPTPPAKSPTGSPLTTQNSWDTLHTTNSAYDIAPDFPIFGAVGKVIWPGGFAAKGSPDFCAARDHLVAAGVGFVDANNDCVIDNPPTAQIRYMIRSDATPRKVFGLAHSTAINALFGADVVAETLGDITQLGDIVFVARPIDDWDMYTGGWFLGGPFPDHLLPQYGSNAASSVCGGKKTSRPRNYGFVCIPEFDVHANAALQTDDLATFTAETLAALDEFGKRAVNIPAYSGGNRWVALRDVAGLVYQRGGGFANSSTLLNARPSDGHTPQHPYHFGGGGQALRWGQKEGTSKLSPFHATTVWDFNVLGAVYDSLLAQSPIEPEKVISWMANNYAVRVDAAGDTHVEFQLRQNLRWHDGQPVRPEDVRFSILNYRDVPADTLVSSVERVKDVVVLDPSTVEVVLAGRSLSHLLNIGGVPIIPQHLWDGNNDGKADASKSDPSFDPLAEGILVGSGPWVCKSVFPVDLGKVGTGCARTPSGGRSGQVIPPGGSMLLERFDFPTPAKPFNQYMRSYNPSWPGSPSGQYQEWSWADWDDDGEVTIVDLTSVMQCLGSAPSDSCPSDTFAHWDRIGPTGAVSIVDAARVFAHLDDTFVGPFSWSAAALQNLVEFAP